MKKRIEKLQEKMKEREFPAFLVTRPENIYYLSGFSGSSGLLLFTPEEAFLLTDFRYLEQAEKEAPDYMLVRSERPRVDKLKDMVSHLEGLAFEAAQITYSRFQEYLEAFIGVDLIPSENLVEELRLIKDKEEISHIRMAVEQADQAFSHILKYIKPGITERDVALELEYFLKKMGVVKIPFPFIVASGERGSLPHGVASEKVLKEGELITMDFGSCWKHYFSDMTRTVALGSVSPRQEEIYQIVLQAQEEAVKTIRAGLTGRQVDGVARDIIETASLGEFFGHGLGHGVGLMVHEGPTLNMKKEDLLEAGMVATVEPGVYIPEWGGVRIEDMVLIEEEGGKILTQSVKELIIL